MVQKKAQLQKRSANSQKRIRYKNTLRKHKIKFSVAVSRDSIKSVILLWKKARTQKSHINSI